MITAVFTVLGIVIYALVTGGAILAFAQNGWNKPEKIKYLNRWVYFGLIFIWPLLWAIVIVIAAVIGLGALAVHLYHKFRKGHTHGTVTTVHPEQPEEGSAAQ